MKLNGIGKIAVLILVLGVSVGLYRMFGTNFSRGGAPRGSVPINSAPVNPQTSTEPLTLIGKIGGEKAGLLEDAEVIKILSDKYGLTLNTSTAGSLDMVRQSVSGQDFLWPSSQVALELYQNKKGVSKNQFAKSLHPPVNERAEPPKPRERG